jgi:hypothetical protein
LVILSVFELPPFHQHFLVLDRSNADRLSMRDYGILASANLRHTIRNKYLQIDVEVMSEDLDLQSVFLKSKGIEPQRKPSIVDLQDMLRQESYY